MPSTALELLKEKGEALSSATRERWSEEQLVAVWDTVAKGLSLAEFAMYTSLAARYELDPFAKEIYAAKGKARDGEPGRLMILVGRDGLLTIARRQPDFVAVDGDVHRKNDHFKVTRRADGERTVEHSYEGGPEERGPILGSWAMVRRRERGAMGAVRTLFTNYVYCPIGEYAPSGGSSFSPWKKQLSAMIAKCSTSLSLRLAYGISGVVGEDEVAAEFASAPAPDDGSGVDLRELPDDLRERLDRVFAVTPTSALPTRAEFQMRVKGQPREKVEQFVAEMEARTRDTAEPDEAEVVEDLGGGDDRPVEAAAGDGELPGNAPEEERPAPAAREEVESLRQRLSGLYDRRTEVEEAPSSHAETAAELDALSEEIDHVEDQLLAAGGQVPGQEALEVEGRA